MRGEWDDSVKAMVARLLKLEPAKEGFALDPARTIIDPVKYHQALLSDAKAGPGAVRSMMGAFQEELAIYLSIREKMDSP